MLNRPAAKVAAALGLLMLAGAVPMFNAWFGNRSARSAEPAQLQSTAEAKQQPSAAVKTEPLKANAPIQSQEEKEIRAFDDLYIRDYNNADAKALAARFTEDAEVVEEDGYRYQGRPLIEERLTETFAENKGAKMAIEIESIRILNPDAVKEEGHTIVTPAKGGAATHRRYTVLLVKREGRWLLSSVREEHEPMLSPHVHLQSLEWMVGDWLDEGADSVVRVNCRWSEDQNFLIRTFQVKHQGKDVMTVTQRIGWDPVARQVRSWEFDSEGGFGEGKWGQEGERWVIKHTATRPEGTTVTATNTLLRERPDLVRWTSADRVVGSESIPDEESYVFVRVPPPPPGHTENPATPAQSPNPERSPR
jgi:uncharacterized protein (TIGR02246 family)